MTTYSYGWRSRKLAASTTAALAANLAHFRSFRPLLEATPLPQGYAYFRSFSPQTQTTSAYFPPELESRTALTSQL